jgi:DUF4097 and DUF4098 domain-containing protein YvlB
MEAQMQKIASVAVALLIGAAAALAGERVDQKRPASRDGVVEINNVAGSVRISGWDRDEVAVVGTLGRGTERLEFSGTDGRTILRVVVPRRSRNVDGSDLEISVPRASRVEVETVSADVTVADIAGRLVAESVSGEIVVHCSSPEVDLKTVSGSLKVAAPAARVHAKTVSGRVEVRGVKGDIDVGSVSGAVTVSAEGVKNCRLETTSGPISLDGSLAPGGRVDANTVSGSIELRLPPDVSAEIEASTFSGDIDNELGPKARRTSEYGPGRELSFSQGSGDGRIKVRAFSGSIALRKK